MNRMTPLIIIGTLGATAGLLMLLLPQTKSKELHQTIGDHRRSGDRWITFQFFWSKYFCVGKGSRGLLGLCSFFFFIHPDKRFFFSMKDTKDVIVLSLQRTSLLILCHMPGTNLHRYNLFLFSALSGCSGGSKPKKSKLKCLKAIWRKLLPTCCMKWKGP